MKAVHLPVLGVIAAALLIWSFGSSNAWGQSPPAGNAKCTYPSDLHPETISRIPMPKRESLTTEEERKSWDARVKVDPEVFTPFHGTAHRLHLPMVSEHTREILLYLRQKGLLEDNLKVLTQLVAARETGNQIEYQMNPKGLTPQIIYIVKNREEPTGLPEKEATIIRLVREMVHMPKVTSKTYADAQRLFGDRGLLAIVTFVTYYSANAMLFRTYDTRLPNCESRF